MIEYVFNKLGLIKENELSCDYNCVLFCIFSFFLFLKDSCVSMLLKCVKM